MVEVLAADVVPTWMWPKSSVGGATPTAAIAAFDLPEQRSLSSPFAGVRVIARSTLLNVPTDAGAKVTVTVIVSPGSRSAGSVLLVAVTL
jgi:hypothetical protein